VTKTWQWRFAPALLTLAWTVGKSTASK